MFCKNTPRCETLPIGLTGSKSKIKALRQVSIEEHILDAYALKQNVLSCQVSLINTSVN
jgi:hypothetical protein